MTMIHEGKLDGAGLRPAIVVARFNSVITGKLLEGALDCLGRHGVDTGTVEVFRVPGAWEVPTVALRVADSGRFDCVICLGAVIRGETPHFEFVSSESAKGIAQAAMLTDVPVVYGIVTADTVEQALDRAGAKAGNRGFDAAMTALEMTSLYGQVAGLETEEDVDGKKS